MGALIAYAAWGGPREPAVGLPIGPNFLEIPPVSADVAAPASDTAKVAVRTKEASAPDSTSSNDVPVVDAPGAGGACPAEMALVQGEYCTTVDQSCTSWLDDMSLPYARCGQYAAPARCTGKRRTMRFCIDRFEYTPSGENLPKNYASFVEASAVCERLGKRICTEDEWTFACEGPDMLPYPYGWARAPVCNQDRNDLYERDRNRQILRDNRVPSGSLKDCRSPFGVHDMAGNLDEPVLRESQRYAYPFRNALKGGWWMAARNRCRPATTAHDDHYRDIQIGVRCCDEAARPGTSEGQGTTDNLD